MVGSAPSSFPSSINDQLDQLVPIQNANLVWKDVGSSNGGDGSNAAHLGPIVIDMTGSGAHDAHSGNELAVIFCARKLLPRFDQFTLGAIRKLF